MLVLNVGGTHYTTRNVPAATVEVPADAPTVKVGHPHAGTDTADYRRLYVREGQYDQVPRGWYLADESGRLKYRIDVPIKRGEKTMDNGEPAPERFKAPQPELFQLIIEGILGGRLQWALVITGALVAISLELMGVSALPVAVGMYLGLGTATPIFVGGMLRWLTDRLRGVSGSEAETETSPGVLLSSGYIAGGTLCGLLLGFVAMLPWEGVMKALNLGRHFGEAYAEGEAVSGKVISLSAFAGLAAVLLILGLRKSVETPGTELPERKV
jgi:hypothetical protein